MKFEVKGFISGNMLREIKDEMGVGHEVIAKEMGLSTTRTNDTPHLLTMTFNVEEDHVITNS